MAATFHHFQRLPAELRAAVWELALHHEQDEDAGNLRTYRRITLHDYDVDSNSVSVRISPAYPNLFAVNREARYETAKLEDCEWMTVHAKHISKSSEDSPDFSIGINFCRDLLELPKDMLNSSQKRAPHEAIHTDEHLHLVTLSRILDSQTLQLIQHLAVATEPPHQSRRLEDRAWWRGEGLELFHLGDLRTVHVSASSCSHASWVKLSVEDHLEYYWVSNGWWTQRPLVKVGRSVSVRAQLRAAYGSIGM